MTGLLRETDVSFYSATFSLEELHKIEKRKIEDVSKLDSRASKRAAKSRTKLLYDLSAIAATLALMGDRK
jgi:hypothetical protein